jgi:hypothetical protein
MQTSEISYLKSWFLFFLIATVGGGLFGMIVGAVLGFFLGASGVPIQSIAIICGVIGFVIGLPISFYTFQWSVRTYIVNPLLRAASAQPPA